MTHNKMGNNIIGLNIKMNTLEASMNYLYNPDIYDDELDEIREQDNRKPVKPISKQVSKPKETKENAIDKFRIIKPTAQAHQDDDDISFDDEVNTSEEIDDIDIEIEDTETEETKEAEVTEDEKANYIFNMLNSNNVDLDSSDDKEITDDIDMDDIEIEGEESEEDTEESSETISANDFEIEGLEEFEAEQESEEDDTEEINIDDIDTSDMFEDEEEPEPEEVVQQAVQSLSSATINDADEDSEEFTIDELEEAESQEEDSQDLEIEGLEELESDNESEEPEQEQDIDALLDIDDSELFGEEETDNNIEIEQDSSSEEETFTLDEDESPTDKEETPKEVAPKEIAKAPSVNVDDFDEEELAEIEKQKELAKKRKEQQKIENTALFDDSNNQNDRIAQLEAEIAAIKAGSQKPKSDGAVSNTQNSKRDDFNKNENSNKQLKLKPIATNDAPESKFAKYNAMTEKNLYPYVFNFMVKAGVQTKMIDIAVLNARFGENNIKRLIQKSYLIKNGKGVTCGL